MRIEPRTILLATDGTPTSAVARRAAGDLAHGSGAALHVVHAWGDPYAGYLPHEQVAEVDEALAIAVAASERERIEADGHRVAQVHTPQGIRGDVILQVAAREEADLIVVGGRKPGVLAELLTARVSQAVLRRARVPVLLIPTTSFWRPARIVAAFGSLEDVQAIAGVASGFADLLGLDIHLAHVVGSHVHESDEATLRCVEAFLDATPAESQTALEVCVLRGSSVTGTLLDICQGDGEALLVMGMREIRELLREGLHSIAEDVTRHTQHPVLLVPEGALADHGLTRRRRGAITV